MTDSFSDNRPEKSFIRQVPASGIDREAIHRIREQGRIERAKIVRRCFVALKRAVRALLPGASHEVSGQRRAGIRS
ncbi:hypothetical protein [Paracoccus methylarcula]|uniref:Uncharacterized protein n=1 Tax=Paracoccus methylarcula TaxID=72022 RepID=A0A3R7M9Q4_9RHOB|nr:hypothetical protein [Paracoccus methylarcula]RNF34995.1 hypothetical protein A7A09_008395 [Paracoccus methylarcula]